MILSRIRITSPCNLYPLTPHVYKVELGLQGYIFFLIFCAYNIDCVCLIKKRIVIFHLKIAIFTAVKNRSILHGHVFVIFTFYHLHSNIFCYVIWWYMYGAKYTIYEYLWYLLTLVFTFMMVLMRSGSFFFLKIVSLEC